ncbi:MAG: CoA transferase [Rhodospirillales bacterium]|nr:CoA transferase [Rhodospirillales bacterium]
MGQQLEILRGISVAEFGDDFAGAVCAYHLHLLGAEVSLYEPPEGCELRRLAARRPTSGLFAYAGRGRISRPLDAFLAAPPAPLPDIVIEPAFSAPAVAAAIEARRDVSPGSILLSFREADATRLTELTAQAEGGITAYLGREAEPPVRVGMEIMSYSAATLAVQAVLAALRVRNTTGRGQSLRVPLSRVSSSILSNVTAASVEPDQPAHFSRGWSHPPARGFAAAGGSIEILFYGPASERGWPGFCHAIGAADIAADPRFDSYAKRLDHGQELAAVLAPYTQSIPRDELIALVRRHDGMAMPKHSVMEAAAWEQSRANAMMTAQGLPAAPWELGGQRAQASGVSP